jgi:hypothetical protein
MKNGDEVWTLSCVNIETTVNITESISRSASKCVDLIEAEASIAPNGLVYFYGDKFGNVKALQLGDTTVPTASPSDLPTSPVTYSPAEYPSASASNSQNDFPFVDPFMSQYPDAKSTSLPTLAPIDWAELLYKSNAGQRRQEGFKVYASIVFVTLLALGL